MFNVIQVRLFLAVVLFVNCDFVLGLDRHCDIALYRLGEDVKNMKVPISPNVHARSMTIHETLSPDGEIYTWKVKEYPEANLKFGLYSGDGEDPAWHEPHIFLYGSRGSTRLRGVNKAMVLTLRHLYPERPFVGELAGTNREKAIDAFLLQPHSPDLTKIPLFQATPGGVWMLVDYSNQGPRFHFLQFPKTQSQDIRIQRTQGFENWLRLMTSAP